MESLSTFKVNSLWMRATMVPLVATTEDDDGRWWVLDWDGLSVGDEAEDLATLVWPFVHSTGQDWRRLLADEGDEQFSSRMDLHVRALALDYLIDVLVDWAECDVPE
jgi:hypothetical protein